MMEEVADVDEASSERPQKLQPDETNESGIGVDLNETETCDNHTISNASLNSETDMSSSPENHHISAKTNDDLMVSEESSLNCSGMKKDDSGIYSEKSPATGLAKEISDGDLTESITESFEENASLKQKGKLDVEQDVKEDFQVKDTELSDKNSDMNSIPDKAVYIDKNVNTNNAKDICAGVSSKSDDISDKEDDLDSDMASILRSKIVKPLVDYGSSDSDKAESAISGVEAKENKQKCYRKRKSDTSEDSVNEDEDDAVTDGTPMLLRHGNLSEPDNMFDVDSDDNSDTSDAEIETKKDSSESEPDDSPIEFGQFGPPKHKWRALFDLRDRERGYPVRGEPGYFRKKIQGSLQMVERFQLQYKLEHHEGCVNALHFNRIGTLLASGSDDLNIVIWNWLRNKPALIYDSGHRSNVFQSKFMPFSGDCHVVSCARDGQIRLADLSSTGVCKGTKKLAQHRGSAHKLALEMDSPHVFLSCGFKEG